MNELYGIAHNLFIFLKICSKPNETIEQEQNNKK